MQYVPTLDVKDGMDEKGKEYMIRFYFYNQQLVLQNEMEVSIADRQILRGGGYMG